MTADFPNVPAMVIPPIGFALALGTSKFVLRVILKIIEASNGEVCTLLVIGTEPLTHVTRLRSTARSSATRMTPGQSAALRMSWTDV